MLISHKGKKPEVHSLAYIAPTATICGDVTIGPNCRVMHGASIIAEGGKIILVSMLSSLRMRWLGAMSNILQP